MTRLVVIVFLTAFLVLTFLGMLFLKDSYKLLPISASSEGAPTQFSGWRDFTSPDKKFTVMFPGLPQNAKQTTRDAKTQELRNYNMYVAEKGDGSIFMISLIQFPDSKQAPEIIQKSVVNDLLAANPANQLKTMKIGDYKGIRTLDFTIENNEMTIDGMTFVQGDTLFMLSSLFRNGSYHPEEYQFFLKSFDLNTGKTP